MDVELLPGGKGCHMSGGQEVEGRGTKNGLAALPPPSFKPSLFLSDLATPSFSLLYVPFSGNPALSVSFFSPSHLATLSFFISLSSIFFLPLLSLPIEEEEED